MIAILSLRKSEMIIASITSVLVMKFSASISVVVVMQFLQSAITYP